MEITSVNNPLVKETVKLHQKKYRDDRQVFIVEGYHLFEEASNAGIIRQVFTTDRRIIAKNVVYVTETVLNKISQMKSSQSVVAVCNKFESKEITDKVLILEKIQDPGNLGALLRSALAFGFDTVILDNTVDLYNDKVIRSTQGAMFQLNIIHMSTLDFINENEQYTIYGTSFDGEEISGLLLDKKLAVVLGNEGNGVSKEVLLKTNKNITIKTKNVESLNVAVAGSIIMHEMSMK
jgi:TrmH family RNA methyltransferase